MPVYKILTADQLDAFQRSGSFEGSEDDKADGFIHLSAGHQVEGTAQKHFAGQQGLWLVALADDRLGDDLKWEVSRGGDRFPHLYRPFGRADVVWIRSLQQEPDGTFYFAEETGP